MPYSKQTWTDETPASSPVKYKITQTTDGDIAPNASIEPVTAITPGSPLNASRLNHMESGIESAANVADAAIPKSLATAIGQFLYSTASGVWAALSKPSVDSILKITSGGTPSWRTLADIVSVANRQGGSSTDWNTPGTTNYTPASPKIQIGCVNVTIGSGSDGATATVTFPTAYSYKPMVFLAASNLPVTYQILTSYSITNTGFLCGVTNPSRNMTVPVMWLAIGQ
ncbi:MAG: hypothetical protein IPL32_18070 [Chloracidobacterium sp.]|nr:hypothetical protein [Chloracidobacterium sp.]